LCLSNPLFAQLKVPEPLIIGFENRQLPPVAFSHTTHLKKSKIDCAVCHHKDKIPKEPRKCLKCHPIKDAIKDAIYDAPLAKIAFHKMCITCHKESLTKEISTPTKCNECHKK